MKLLIRSGPCAGLQLCWLQTTESEDAEHISAGRAKLQRRMSSRWSSGIYKPKWNDWQTTPRKRLMNHSFLWSCSPFYPPWLDRDKAFDFGMARWNPMKISMPCWKLPLHIWPFEANLRLITWLGYHLSCHVVISYTTWFCYDVLTKPWLISHTL